MIDGDRALFGDIDFEFASGWMMTDAFFDGYGARPAETPDCLITLHVVQMTHGATCCA